MNAKNEPISLAIDVNSWHFKYYKRIREYYGADTPESSGTSLCPYVQTMIWGSLFFVLSLPIQILGWVTMKLCRFIYKQCESSGFTGIVDFVDYTPAGRVLDTSDDLNKIPFIISLMWGVATLLITSMLVMIFGVFMIGVWNVILSIPYWPAAIWSFILYLGWMMVLMGWGLSAVFIGLFDLSIWLFVAAWDAMCQFWGFLVWFFTTAWIWQLVGNIVLGFVATVCGTFAVGWLLFTIGSSTTFKSVINFISMRFNGYKEAKASAAQRRSAEPSSDSGDEVTVYKCVVCNYFHGIVESVFDTFENIVGFFTSKVVMSGKTKKKILSPFGIAWVYVCAVKKQMCPIVSFIDSHTLPPPEPEEKPLPNNEPENAPTVPDEILNNENKEGQ